MTNLKSFTRQNILNKLALSLVYPNSHSPYPVAQTYGWQQPHDTKPSRLHTGKGHSTYQVPVLSANYRRQSRNLFLFYMFFNLYICLLYFHCLCSDELACLIPALVTSLIQTRSSNNSHSRITPFFVGTDASY